MDILFWGLTFGIIGKVILAFTVISVHRKIVKEHKIDGKVLHEMIRERNLAFLGLVFMVIGYILEIIFYDFF